MDRTKTLFSFTLLAIAVTTAGCGLNQQSRFQSHFLPPAPRSDTAIDIAPPPVVQPNLYVKDVPAFFVSAPQVPARRTAADSLMLRADQRFQRGKRSYQSKDIPGARQLFDEAIDLMLEATAESQSDRRPYEQHLDEMVDQIHRMDLAGLGAAAGVEEGKFEKAPLEDILQMTFPLDPRLKDRVREQVASSVSQLPLSVTDAVLGYINYFSNRGHRTVVAGIERSGRYRPMIQRILDEEGVPQELIHLAQAESGFIPRAMSRKAAGGMWQFLVSRGQQYGLNRTASTDERMDPEKATRAAARHLHDLYNEFGDWYLAIAAYNCGPGVVERAVEQTGYADFWELRRIGVLPIETTNYVPIILAMTIMQKNAAEYGLEGIQMEPPLEYDTVELSSATSMQLISDITDTPLPELAALNPAVLKSTAPAAFSMHVPKGTGTQLTTALQLIPEGHRDTWRMHRVGTGETLASIGKRYGISASSILAVNKLATAETVEGDRLLIPAAPRPEPQPVRRTTTVRHTTPAKPGAGVRKTTASTSKPAVILAKSGK